MAAMSGGRMSVWFGDEQQIALEPTDMYLAVYAAGGGKRNMANFVRAGRPDPLPVGTEPRFRSADVHVFVTQAEVSAAARSQLFICR